MSMSKSDPKETNMSLAEQIYNHLMDVRTGTITPDAYREWAGPKRDEVGETTWQMAQIKAISFDVKHNG